MRIAIDFDKKVPNANKDVGAVNLAAAGWLYGAMADRDYSRQLHDVGILVDGTVPPRGELIARNIDVPPGRISEIIRAKRAITAGTALRLGKCFNVSPELWLNLQTDYEIRVARRTTWPTIQSHIKACVVSR